MEEAQVGDMRYDLIESLVNSGLGQISNSGGMRTEIIFFISFTFLHFLDLDVQFEDTPRNSNKCQGAIINSRNLMKWRQSCPSLKHRIARDGCWKHMLDCVVPYLSNICFKLLASGSPWIILQYFFIETSKRKRLILLALAAIIHKKRERNLEEGSNYGNGQRKDWWWLNRGGIWPEERETEDVNSA